MKTRFMVLVAALAFLGTTAHAGMRPGDPNDSRSIQGQRYKAQVKSSVGCKYSAEGNHSQVPRIQRTAAAAAPQKPTSGARTNR